MYKFYKSKRSILFDILGAIILSIFTVLVIATFASLLAGGVEFLILGGADKQIIHSNYLLIHIKNPEIRYVDIHHDNRVISDTKIVNINDKGWEYDLNNPLPASPSYSVLVEDENHNLINGAWFIKSNSSANNIISTSISTKQTIGLTNNETVFIGTQVNAKYLVIIADSVFFNIEDNINKSSNKLFYEMFCGNFTATAYNSNGLKIVDNNFLMICDSNLAFLTTMSSRWPLVIISFLIYLFILTLIRTKIIHNKIMRIIKKFI